MVQLSTHNAEVGGSSPPVEVSIINPWFVSGSDWSRAEPHRAPHHTSTLYPRVIANNVGGSGHEALARIDTWFKDHPIRIGEQHL